MAKPIYGGWVSFTAHLALTYNINIYKIAKRSEKNGRNFGYGLKYKNITIEDASQLDNIMITAIDKHYLPYLNLLPKNNISLVIHDPTELNKSLLDIINNFKIYTIRKTVQNLLKNKYNIDSIFKYHPFHKYKINKEKDNFNNYKYLSISRIDFDKNIDIILKANKIINDKIYLFGAENRLYVHHKLKDLDFHDYWLGKFPKTLPIEYKDHSLLDNCKYIIDLSTIKNDGGGTQYTFLEAIYHNCVLILNEEWVNKGDTFKNNYNCYTIKNEEDLKNIIESDNEENNKKIIKNARLLLKTHTQKDWLN